MELNIYGFVMVIKDIISMKVIFGFVFMSAKL